MRAAVVGAGIGGLTAAFRLQQAGYEVEVLEASDHVGGRMSTIEHRGHLIDVGAAVVSSKYAPVLSLARELGVADQLVKTTAVMGIVRGGEIHRLDSSNPIAALRTKLLSARAKTAARKLAADAWRMRNTLDPERNPASTQHRETVTDYGRRRLSPELFDYLVDPMVRTVHLRDNHEITAANLFSIMAGFFGGSFLNTASGMDWLCRALGERIPVALNTAALGVTESPSGVRVTVLADGHERVVDADVCVIALDARRMADVHGGLDAAQRGLISELRYGNLMSIAVGLSRPTGEQAAMIAVPTRESDDLCAITVDERRAPGRVPPGKGLLGTHWSPRFVEKYWAADDSDVSDAAIRDIETVFPNVPNTVEWVRVHRHSPGVMIGGTETYDVLRRFHCSYPTKSRIQVAGDFFGAVTFSSSLASGERAALRCRRSRSMAS